jgi:hypothetical protein
MKHRSMGTSALLALLIAAGLATAQTTTTTPTYESAVTTGIVTLMPSTQTAQLNVLNTGGFLALGILGSTPTNPVAACPVELEFRDAQNNVLKSLSVSNLAAGTAATLTMKISDLPAAAVVFRLDIRGVVKSNPIVSGPIPAASMPIFPVFSSCSVLPTLELFDTSTGITQTFTSDTRPFGTPVVVPLAIKN